MIPRYLAEHWALISRNVRRVFISFVIIIFTLISGLVYFAHQLAEKSESRLYVPIASNPKGPIQQISNKKNTVKEATVSFAQLQILFDTFFKQKKLVGKGAYIVAWDIKTHTFHDIYSQNADVPYNSASIAKLVTALTLSKYAEMSKFLDTTDSGKDETFADFPDKLFQKQDLVAAMLIQSSNQAAYTLAKPFGTTKFIEMMNAEAEKIGLSHSILRDPSGLDERNLRGASYMSPRDVARAAFELVSRFPEITKLSSRSAYDITDKMGGKFSLHNTNPLVASTKNVLLSKTGYTNLAGGNLVMVIEPSPDIWVAMVVMKSTKDDRVVDMEKLIDTINQTFDTYQKLAKAG